MSSGKPAVQEVQDTSLICSYGCGCPALFLLGARKRPCCSVHYTKCPGILGAVLHVLSPQICKYGCNQPAKFLLGNKRFPCCGKSFNSCPGWKSKTVSGPGNPSFSTSAKQKREQTFLARFGTTNPLKNASVRAQANKTCQQRYGGNSPMCSEKVVRKRKATCLEKYGVENAVQAVSVQQKSRDSCLEKYGVPFAFQADDVKQKIEMTNLRRYGVSNPAMDPVIYAKGMRTRFQSKPYTFPSGRIVYLQGYEHQVLTELLNSGIHEKDIRCSAGEVPSFKYFDPIAQRVRRYFPDFFLPRLNWIIEVKSRWTFSGEPGWLQINMAKREACIRAGYKFNFLIRSANNARTHSL